MLEILTNPQTILASVRQGNPLVILDDRREFEGDLFCAAELATPEVLHFMVRQCSGFLCLAMARQKLELMGIPRISDITSFLGDMDWIPEPWESFLEHLVRQKADTPFHFPVDARVCHSGISVEDRYTTIQAMLNVRASVSDFSIPGHLPLLGSHPLGFKGRIGHTESAVELCQMAGLKPAGLLCEILSEDGTMATGQELQDFAEKNSLQIVTITDLVKIRGQL